MEKLIYSGNTLYELSNAQKRIYLSQQLYEGYPVFNNAGYVIFDEVVHLDRLENAIKRTIEGMDIFSIRLIKKEGQIYQYFDGDTKQCDSIRKFIGGDGENSLFQKAMYEFSYSTFELYQKPLYKFLIFQIDDNRSGYAINFHHIISDGWTIKLLTEAIGYYYDLQCGVACEEFTLHAYKDYLQQENDYLQSKKAMKDCDLWLSLLKEKSKLCTKMIGNNKSGGVRVSRDIPDIMHRGIEQINSKGYETAVILATAIQLYLLLNHNEYAPLMGVPMYNRVNRCTKQTAGMFTSTVVLGIDIQDHMTLDDLMMSMRGELRNSLRYQQYPYNLMYTKLKAMNHEVQELFQYSVNCYNMNLSTSLNGCVGRYIELYSGHQAIPIQIIYKVWNRTESKIVIDYRKDCFTEQQISNILLFLQDFITKGAMNTELTVEKFKEELVADNKKKQQQFLKVANMQQLSFDDLLKGITKHPVNDIAIYTVDEAIEYGMFQRLINNSITYFKKLGVNLSDRIIMFMDNSIEYVVSCWACFLIGAVVIPLDTSTKETQLAYIIQHCNAKYIITNQVCEQNYSVEVIEAKLDYKTQGIGLEHRLETLDENKIAYIIYTSGTTGDPKGVTITRKNIANYLCWGKALYCSKKRIFFMFSSPAFDLSITTLLLPYVSGGSVVIDEKHSTIYELTRTRYASKINMLKATPSQLELLLAQKCEGISLEVIISGGEELTESLGERLKQTFGEGLSIYNEYGPTEATIGCMSYIYQREDGKNAVPIGIPTPGTKIYLIKNNELVYGHEVGEMYIGGVQVSPGYLNNDRENEEHFVHIDGIEEILYKSGDLAFINEQGQLEYIGRSVREYKVNGFRIELGSIENVIKNIEGVQNCIASVVKENQMDYIVAVVQTETKSKENIIEVVKNQLPDYYIPHYVYITDNIPLANSGKADYSYINKMIEQQSLHVLKTEMSIGTEERIYELCEQVLASGRSMNNYNLLEAGADSIKSILIQAKLKEYGFNVSLVDIILHPKLKELVHYVANEDNKKIDTQLSETIGLPKNVEYLSSTTDTFSEYVQSMIFRIKESVNKEQIDQAFIRLVKQYPLLGYHLSDNQLQKNQHAKEWVQWIPVESFDEVETVLKKVPDASIQLIQMKGFVLKNEMIVGIQLHHIIADGLSWKCVLDTFANNLTTKQDKVYADCGYEEFAKKMKQNTLYHTGNECIGEYRYRQQSVSYSEEDRNIRKSVIELAVEEAIKKEVANLSCELWVEWDARKIDEFKEFTNSLGCFSIFLSMDDLRSLESGQIRTMDECNKLLYNDQNIVRLNDLGHVQELVHDNLELYSCSIDLSLEKCSAYGCLFELTLFEWDEELRIYLTTRDYRVSEGVMERILLDIQTVLLSKQDSLVDLSEDELSVLFEED